MIYNNLVVPRWIQQGIRPSERGGRVDRLIFGADTETCKGLPLSLQFYSEDIPCEKIVFCKECGGKEFARRAFLAWCDSLPSDVECVVYIHNLAFDLVELLWGEHEKLKENGSTFDFDSDGYRIRGCYGSPTFCTLRKGSHRIVHLVDSWSFYRGTLLTAATLYCPQLPKLQQPLGLGQRRFTSKNDDFVQYALRDAQVSYHIGKAINDLHREFDIGQSVSVADLASRIFRKTHLSYTIPATDRAIIEASMSAYHGGKNNITVAPGWYERVNSIDVSSAYPAAMLELPSFANPALYKPYVHTRAVRRTLRVPEFGVYRVTGEAAHCKWPSLFSHAFKPLRGPFGPTWVQGFELNAALDAGEVRLSRVHGYFYDAAKDNTPSALKGFCQEFYRRKQTEPDKVRRYGWKLILNSISGKFIQTRKHTHKCRVDIDGASYEVSSAADLVAGGLFHPFIAAAITAHTRARIHALEHHYQALHTATDGIFTQRKPNTSGEFRVVEKATRLGDLENDYSGTLLLLRNKLYVLYRQRSCDAGSDSSGTESQYYRGARISKFALHGFQGTIGTLERLVATGQRDYRISRANRLGESISRGLQPNKWREIDLELKVPPIEAAPFDLRPGPLQ